MKNTGVLWGGGGSSFSLYFRQVFKGLSGEGCNYLCWEWAYCYQNLQYSSWAFLGDLLCASAHLATGEIHRGVRKTCLGVHSLQTPSRDRSGWVGGRDLPSWRESGKASRRGVLGLGQADTYNCHLAHCTMERASSDSTSLFRPIGTILCTGNCP